MSGRATLLCSLASSEVYLRGRPRFTTDADVDAPDSIAHLSYNKVSLFNLSPLQYKKHLPQERVQWCDCDLSLPSL